MAALLIAGVLWAALEKIWAPLLLPVPLLLLAVPSFRQRVEAGVRLPTVIWRGVFFGIWFGVWWSAIWGESATRSALAGLFFGVFQTIVFAATWKREQRKEQDRLARREHELLGGHDPSGPGWLRRWLNGSWGT